MVERVNDSDKILVQIPVSKDESLVLEGFKSLIQKENLKYNREVVDDCYLIRFLRARKLKLDKALEMFKKYIKWREEFELDTIQSFTYPEEPDVLALYPQGLHKVDKQGRPIYYELLGKLDMEKLLQVTSLDRLFKYNIQRLEIYLSHIFPAASRSAQKNISQFFSIIDLKGFSAKLMSKKVYDYLKTTLTTTQNYYPEMLGQMYIINSNLVFKGCWAVIKAFLDDKTKAKIIFTGKEYKKKLLQHVCTYANLYYVI